MTEVPRRGKRDRMLKVSIPIEEGLHERLRVLADREERSIASFVRLAMRERIERLEGAQRA